jgi:hypothetical protein
MHHWLGKNTLYVQLEATSSVFRPHSPIWQEMSSFGVLAIEVLSNLILYLARNVVLFSTDDAKLAYVVSLLSLSTRVLHLFAEIEQSGGSP